MPSTERTFWRDAVRVGLYCLVLFGFAGFSGRPLTMHEARLPETSREMLAHHQWLLPTSGGRPWLERPPLPHWLVIAAMKLFGRNDQVWVVRLPSALMGTATVLLTLYISRKWFDPTIGLLSACLLATSFKFYQYASLAEDDIYLAALVALAAALFTRAECAAAAQTPVLRYSEEPDVSAAPAGTSEPLTTGLGAASARALAAFFSNRPWPIWGFFIVLGLSNLAKGPLLGIAILGCPVAVYAFSRAIIERRLQPVLRYTWLWGWLLLIALTLAWPLWAYHRYPDVIENWKYDYLGRMSGAYSAINEPWWYYPPQLVVGLLPWSPFCLLGLVAGIVVLRTVLWPKSVPRRGTITRASRGEHRDQQVLEYRGWGNEPWWCSPPKLVERLLCWLPSNWYGRTLRLQSAVDHEAHQAIRAVRSYLWVLCWALVPLIVLSIPKGKHDHYLVPFLAPWAILGAIGLLAACRFVGLHVRGAPTIVTLIVLLLGYCTGEAIFADRTDHTIDDTAFILRCRHEVPADVPLYIDAKLGPPGNLDFFRLQFYSRPDALLLHNLSFLRAQNITSPVVYVICRAKDRRLLDQLGTVRQIDQSAKSHEIETPAGRFTLFRLTFDPHLTRYPVPAYITSLQAMERAPGPWCGPPLQ